jgi:hypothetical protein
MNEQIRECWIKAAREDAGETWDSQEQFIQRFAELIVRECARVADESLNIITMKPEWPSKYIKEHFGVES